MSSKAKDKKAQRKAEQAAIQQRLNTVRAALVQPDGSVRDLLAEVRPFCRFDRGGVAAELSFFTPATMPDDVRAFVYDLTKLNMEDMYITAGWGWNEAKKKRELYEPDARFIVFRRVVGSSEPAGDGSTSVASAVSVPYWSCFMTCTKGLARIRVVLVKIESHCGVFHHFYSCANAFHCFCVCSRASKLYVCVVSLVRSCDSGSRRASGLCTHEVPR